MIRRVAMVAMACLLVLACRAGGAESPESDTRGANLPPAPEPPYEVEILMAGKPPHEPLRFVPSKDTEAQTVILWRYYSKLGPNVAAYENTSDKWTLMTEVGPGDHDGSFMGTISTLLQDVGEPAPLARIEMRGPIGSFTRLRDEKTWQLGLFDRLATAFPEDAIGEGAVWQAVTQDESGAQIRVIYELLEIDHDVLHLKGESSLVDNTPAATTTTTTTTMTTITPPPSTVVQGDFEIWWKTGSPLPHRGRLKERRTTYHPNGADVEVLELVLEPPGFVPADTKEDAGW
jgi:hypothetical protein